MDQKPHFGGTSDEDSKHGGQDTDQSAANEGINADEFEHIAEIYDQIRTLHQMFLFNEHSSMEIKTKIDRNLANYFDTKLK